MNTDDDDDVQLVKLEIEKAKQRGDSELTLRSAYGSTPGVARVSHKRLVRALERGERFVLYIHPHGCKIARASFKAIKHIAQRIHATRNSKRDVVIVSTEGDKKESPSASESVFDYWLGLANKGKSIREKTVPLSAGAQCFVVENGKVVAIEVESPGCIAFPASNLVGDASDESNESDDVPKELRESVNKQLDQLAASLLGPYIKPNVLIQIDVPLTAEIDRLETALMALNESSVLLRPHLVHAMSMKLHGAHPSTFLVMPSDFQRRVRSGATARHFLESAFRLEQGNGHLWSSYLRLSQDLIEKDGGVDKILKNRYHCDDMRNDTHHAATSVEEQEENADGKESTNSEETKDNDVSDKRVSSLPGLLIEKPWTYFVSYDGRAMMRPRLGPVAVSWEMTPSEMVQSACGLILAIPPLAERVLAVDHGIQSRDDLPPLWVWDASTDRTYVNRHALGFLLRLARHIRQTSKVEASSYGGISASPDLEAEVIKRPHGLNLGRTIPDEMSGILAAAVYRSLDRLDRKNTDESNRENKRRLIAPYSSMSDLRRMARESEDQQI